MSAATFFSGAFTVTPPLQERHYQYLLAFSETRRMKRNAAITQTRPDPVREATGLDVGPDGAYFVGAAAAAAAMPGQDCDAPDVIDVNAPPADQPSLWCPWSPKDYAALRTAAEWDDDADVYDYIAWIVYLIRQFLGPWGYVLNGTVQWSGEKLYDHGIITVEQNEVKVSVAPMLSTRE